MKKALWTGEEHCVGRDPAQADIVLDNSLVSRRHCRILWDDEAECFWVRDISSNGCSVSGKGTLIHDVFVKAEPGEEILITNTDYKLCLIFEKRRRWMGKDK